MKSLFTVLLGIIPLLAQSQEADRSLCLQLQGKVIDQTTDQPLTTAKFTAQTSTGQFIVGSSNETGQFTIQLPCSTKKLTIERTGYRPQTISIQPSSIHKSQPIVLLIPLLAGDKQDTDTPYLQSEQTSYIQSDKPTIGAFAPKQQAVQRNTFLVTDAIYKKPLSATACFFFTKSGDKQCLQTNEAGWFPINFNQKDIVAIEISATGYQSYYGNMLIELLDGRSLKHQIQLQREFTILTVNAPDAVNCELRLRNQTIKLLLSEGYTNQYVAYGLTPEQAELVVTYRTQEIRRTIRLHTGLNFTSVTQPSTEPVNKLISADVTTAQTREIDKNKALTSFLMDSIPLIYFEQSSYHLRHDSQLVLTQVASYLKAHPSYSLQITGHTDNVGNPEINQTLSFYRARATATFLTSQGIAETRLQKDGIGSSQPIAPNTTEANKMLNRRVSLKLFTAQ